MQVETLAALSLNVPEWFDRDDFKAWLNAPGPGLATWHTPGSEPGEYSDTFIMFDAGESKDFDELFPADLRAQLCQVCEAHGVSYGVLRLTNLSEADERPGQ